jgi:ABC-type uncharacterized transport system permease subunit
MSSNNSKTASITRRLDRTIRRQRLRAGLLIAGVALVIVGAFMATGSFGPPVSSTVAIPKADPYAGLWLVQSLPSETAQLLGLIVGVTGVVLLVAFVLLRGSKSRNDLSRKV